MNYTQLTDTDVQRMLATIGVERTEDLFQGIPSSLRLNRPLHLPAPMTEMEVLADLNRLANANQYRPKR